MKYILLLFVCAAAYSSAQPISSPTEFKEQPFNVLRYELDVTYEQPTSKEAVGRCDIFLEWTEDNNAPSFPVHLRGLEIDSVISKGQLLSFTESGNVSADTFHFRVPLGRSVSAGERDTLYVFFSGRMTTEGGRSAWGGVWYEDQILYAMGVGFYNPNVSATQHWMPCYDHPSDKAELQATFWVPKGLVVASIGEFVSTIESPDSDLIGYRWEEKHPTATYLYTFAVGDYTQLDLDADNEIPHVVFTKERDLDASAITYKLVPEATALFEELYGEYPFNKVGFVNANRGAMEHQTMVTMPLSVINTRDTAHTTSIHELAHQWFGNAVSPIDFSHAWLTESFATYSEAAWVEQLFGHDFYLQTLENGIKNYTQGIADREGVLPLYDFPRAFPSSNYPETIYRKGQLVLAMARLIAGDEAFYAALRGYIEQHRYGTASTDDMREAMRPALGNLTDHFFDQWVVARGWPRLALTLEPGHSSWTARITQVQEGQDGDWPLFTALPIEMTYHDPLTNLPKDTVVIMTSKELAIEIASPTDFQINSGTQGRSLLEVTSVTTVVEPRVDAHGVIVAPNPAGDSATITRLSTLDAARIDITNISGENLFSAIIVHGEPSVVVNTSSWPAGSYMVRVMNEYSITAVPLQIKR